MSPLSPYFPSPCLSVGREEETHRKRHRHHRVPGRRGRLTLLQTVHDPITLHPYPTSPFYPSVLPLTYQFYRSPISSTAHLSVLPITYQFYRSPISSTAHLSVLPLTSQFYRSPLSSTAHLSVLPITYQFYCSPIILRIYWCYFRVNEHIISSTHIVYRDIYRVYIFQYTVFLFNIYSQIQFNILIWLARYFYIVCYLVQMMFHQSA
jgi:hypothetical protein